MRTFLKKFLPNRDYVFLLAACAFLGGILFAAERCSNVNFESLAKLNAAKNKKNTAGQGTDTGTAPNAYCGGSVFDSVKGVNVCPGIQEMVNATCVDICSTGQTHIGNSCQCISGATVVNGVCIISACPSNQTFNAQNGCSCASGQDNVSGTCYTPCLCGQSRDINTKQCLCPAGQELYNGACTAQCTGGRTRVNNQCVCGAGQTADANGNCVGVCPPNQSANSSGGCSCKLPLESYQNSCVPTCLVGQSRDGNGVCQCPSEQEIVANTCSPKCSGGQMRNNQTLKCECDFSTQDLVNGLCLSKCSGGTTRNPSNPAQCICAAQGSLPVNGVCTCPATGLQSPDSGTCPTMCVEPKVPDGQGGCGCPSNLPVEINGVCYAATTPTPTPTPAPNNTTCATIGCHEEAGIQVCNVQPGGNFTVAGTAHYGAGFPTILPALGLGAPRLGYIPPGFPFTCTAAGGERAVGTGNSLLPGVDGRICEINFDNKNFTSATGTATYTVFAAGNAEPSDTLLYDFGLNCNYGCTWDQADFKVRICK
jgi:hypothetical protein